MDPFFFRVDHGLLRSDSFKELGGSAIKVYLVIGLYADFGTGWAYPSIRTIARQGGLSRQTVLAAIAELTRRGLLATSKSSGRSTAYKIIREIPKAGNRPPKAPKTPTATVPRFLEEAGEAVPDFLEVPPQAVPISCEALAQFLGPSGPEARPGGRAGGPNLEPTTREDNNTSIPIPGTPFHLTVEGRLRVAANLQDLLRDQGIPERMAERIVSKNDPEEIAKILLNAYYLQSQGKLQNGPGYIRAGIEDGYELLPQVASRLESRRRELEAQQRQVAHQRERKQAEASRDAEQAAMDFVIDQLRPEELQRLVRQAVASLPEPIVRRNPTLSNPFVRTRVYELAGGEPLD